MRWRVDYERIVWWYHLAETIHEEPRYFRWHWLAWLSAFRYCQRHPWGAATLSERKVPALPPNVDPYRGIAAAP